MNNGKRSALGPSLPTLEKGIEGDLTRIYYTFNSTLGNKYAGYIQISYYFRW
jgi:hypothetical protein